MRRASVLQGEPKGCGSGQEGSEPLSRCSGAEGPTSSGVPPQAASPPHPTGLEDTAPRVASAYPLSPGKREEGVTGQGAPLRGAKYLGRPAWRPLSPGSPGAAAGRGWPAWGRKWVQEGQEQDPEARPPPTMRRPPATIPGQGQGQGSAGEGGPHTSRFMLRVGFRGKAPSAGGAKPSTVPPAISYQ